MLIFLSTFIISLDNILTGQCSLFINHTAYERRLRYANANIGVARSAFFSTHFSHNNYRQCKKELSDLFETSSGAWIFMPQITLPIFDPKTWSAYDVAKEEKELMIANYEKAIETAFKETADALSVRDSINKQIVI